MDANGLDDGPLTGLCGLGREHSGLIEGWKFVYHQGDY